MLQEEGTKRRKRVNTQIQNKIENYRRSLTKDIKTIDRYQYEQSRVQLNQQSYNEHNLLNMLDYDFVKYSSHIPLQLDKTYKLSLHNHHQQFYCLDMQNLIFPIQLFLTNIKNKGLLYIGYNKQYPGISQISNKSNYHQKSIQKQKNYDIKIVLKKDMIITLKSKGYQKVNSIYFSYIAGPQLLILDFRAEFIGFVREQRCISELKSKIMAFDISKFQLNYKAEDPLMKLQTQPSDGLKQFVKTKNIAKLQKLTKDIKLQQFRVFDDLQQKIKANIRPINANETPKLGKLYLNPNKNKSQSLAVLKLNKITHELLQNKNQGEIDMKMQQVKRNKEVLQIFRQKDKLIREKANECKILIEKYQKIYKQESVKTRGLNRQLSIIIYSLIFTKKAYNTFVAKIKNQTIMIKVQDICLKFIMKLKIAHKSNCKLLLYKRQRIYHQVVHSITMSSKIIVKKSLLKAQKVIKHTFFFFLPQLLLSNCILKAEKYKKGIRYIQRIWIIKYENRKKVLLYFLNDHVAKMINQFPHFSQFINDFYKDKVNHKLIVQYLKDQSEKYRYIYDSYLRKEQQVRQIIEISKRNIKSQSKLVIPNAPIRPIHRFFRNLDILRSMSRQWFQIQYKKYVKKNDHYK